MTTNADLENELREGFDELREQLGDEEVRELIALFISDSESRIGTLERAISRGDGDVVMTEAHTLKGAMAGVGAMTLSRLCAELEHAGRNGALDVAPSLWTHLSRQFQSVRSRFWTLANAA